MKVRNKDSHRRRVFSVFLLLPLLLVIFLHARTPVNATAAVARKPVSVIRTPQNPNEAENYRKLAAAKRKAAENVPAKRDCYLAWARYYDCLAAKSEAGDYRDCGRQPDDC
jgi:hypothetical protein